MQNVIDKIELMFAALGAFLGWFFGGFDGFLYALIIFVVMDYFTGILAGGLGNDFALIPLVLGAGEHDLLGHGDDLGQLGRHDLVGRDVDAGSSELGDLACQMLKVNDHARPHDVDGLISEYT